MNALILLAEGFEDISLIVPWYRLREEGVKVRLASPLMRGLTGEHGYRVEPDLPIHEVSPAEYDLLLLPDGIANERIRIREEAVGVARTFMEEDRPVAAIGRGPQLLISAGSLDGKTVTCAPGIRDDVRAAGAFYRDEATILDGMLLTCRGMDDLPTFCLRLIRLMRSANKVSG